MDFLAGKYDPNAAAAPVSDAIPDNFNAKNDMLDADDVANMS
jgi:hypothetical protein